MTVQRSDLPTIAFMVLAGGGFGGATIRDLRLARALKRRGYRVVVYWLMGSNRNLLGPGIPSRRLCSGARFIARRPLAGLDLAARVLDRRSEARQHRSEQRLPTLQARGLANMTDILSRPGGGDPGLVRRLERLLVADGVSHLLVGMGFFAVLGDAVLARGRHRFRQHVTIQGDEMGLHYLQDPAIRERARARLAEIAARPGSVAVSEAYAREMERILDLPAGSLPVLHPGIDLQPPMERAEALARLRRLLPDFDPARPLVSFVGRVDSEKGVDLLLYALRILQERGRRPQIAIAGGPCFGLHYERACHRIARQMELPAQFLGPVAERDRDALFRISRCVVYPPIHVEGFGMVAAEAMAQEAPLVVPRRGGLVEAVTEGDQAGGLLFEPWDSADLARQIEALLTDDALRARMAAAGPALARRFDVETIADRLLAQLDLPPRA